MQQEGEAGAEERPEPGDIGSSKNPPPTHPQGPWMEISGHELRRKNRFRCFKPSRLWRSVPATPGN